MRRVAGILLLAMAALAGPVLADDDHVPDEISSLDEQGQTDAMRFVTGNVIYVLFHEAGHMLVSELNLPVLGREEDAVDTLSSVLLLEAKDKALDQALEDSVDSWLTAGENYGTPDDSDFMDTHSLDKQRAYNIACMMVGQDQQRFKAFADRIKLPQERRDECEGEYQKARDSWFSVLKPYMAEDGDKVDFKIGYDTTRDPDLAYYRSFIKELGALEIIRDTFSGLVRLKPGIVLNATVCKEENAYWNADDRTLTYCYEDARSYGKMYSEKHQPEASGDTTQTDDATATDSAADDSATDDSGTTTGDAGADQ
nr:DUF4344 domain-containing metallopeptidase [uncultured Gellertiella sp.]